MKIAVNTRLLLKDRLDGIGRFSFETLKRITQNHPEHEFTFFFDRTFDEQFIFSSNITPVVLPLQARHPMLFLSWFEVSVPLALKKHKPDLFLSPEGYLCLGTKVPSISVIHDLNFEHYPEDVPLSVRLYFRSMFPKFAAKAKRIATVSEFSKNDIVAQYHQDPDKIDVVYNGSSENFKPIDQHAKNEIRHEFSGGAPYFLFVGSVNPRKNLKNLFKAFDVFRNTDMQGFKLVIAGSNMYWDSELKKTYNNLKYKDDVILLGRVPEENLNGLIASATALTFVSHFEGFGIPILEAFHCETPVITSDVTSLPEVAGNAALYVQPHSVESITTALIRISSDEALRNELVRAGIIQRKLFSWDQSAAKLWQCIEKTMES